MFGPCRCASQLLALIVAFIAVSPTISAAPVLPGDILVSTTASLGSGTIREYTPGGILVQTFTVSAAPGGDTYPRDIAVDSFGRINIWNGTFDPFLTTLTPGVMPSAASSVNNTFAGWSTVNATYFGGIAVGTNYAYVTDMATFGGGGDEANGVVRFDLATFQAIRFAEGTPNGHGDYIDLNLGQDGLLYAIYPGGSPAGNMLDVIDPLTMSLIRTVNLNMDLGAIAVDRDGNIYATSPFDGHIIRFNAAGTVTGSLVTGASGLRDLDLSEDGRLLTFSTDGKAFLSDTTLTSQTSFNIGSAQTFYGAFVPVPEPRSLALALLGFGMLLFWARWRRRRARF